MPAEPVNGQDERRIRAAVDSPARLCRQAIKGATARSEPLPVKRTVKKYKVFLASSQALLATFYAAKHNSCFSIGVNTPKLRCTLLVL